MDLLYTIFVLITSIVRKICPLLSSDETWKSTKRGMYFKRGLFTLPLNECLILYVDRAIFEEWRFLLCFNHLCCNLSYCTTFIKIHNILIFYEGYEISHQSWYFFPCSYSEHTYSMWKAFWNNIQNFIIAQGKQVNFWRSEC